MCALRHAGMRPSPGVMPAHRESRSTTHVLRRWQLPPPIALTATVDAESSGAAPNATANHTVFMAAPPFFSSQAIQESVDDRLRRRQPIRLSRVRDSWDSLGMASDREKGSGRRSCPTFTISVQGAPDRDLKIIVAHEPVEDDRAEPAERENADNDRARRSYC